MDRDPAVLARAREAAASSAYADLRPPGATDAFAKVSEREARDGYADAVGEGASRITIAFDRSTYAAVKAAARAEGLPPGKWITATVTASVTRNQEGT